VDDTISLPVRVGIGGWTFEAWRDNFYPHDLAHKHELEYASRQVTSIEINGTYYGLQKPESFTRWYEETPGDFVFTLKAPRFTTNRHKLAEAGSSIEKFLASGVAELKEKLGPINWQFPPFKPYLPEDFEAFLKLLPRSVDGVRLQHAVEVRHDSFAIAEFVELLRAYQVAAVFTDKPGVPHIHDITGSFVYVRLQRCSEPFDTGYPERELECWAERARTWAAGKEPDDLARLAQPMDGAPLPRDVFVYMINGFKPKAPAAAMALLDRLRCS
jgi:uncharacterized protein YecE (DUF72 family)